MKTLILVMNFFHNFLEEYTTQLLTSTDTRPGRLSWVFHGEVLGTWGCQREAGEYLGALSVCWKRHTDSCCPIKKCELSKKAERFRAYSCACRC